MFAVVLIGLVAHVLAGHHFLPLQDGGVPRSVMATRSTMNCSFVATTSVLYAFNTTGKSRQGLNLFEMPNLISSPSAKALAFQMMDDPETGRTYAIVADSAGGISFSYITSCNDASFVLDYDWHLDYNGTTWLGAGDGLGFGTPTDITFFGNNKIVRLGWTNGVGGRIIGVKAVSELNQTIETSDTVVGYGASSKRGAGFMVTTKLGLEVDARSVNFAFSSDGSLNGYSSFQLQKPVFGRAFGGALVSSYGYAPQHLAPVSQMSFVAPSLDPIKFTPLQFGQPQNIIALRTSQRVKRVGTASYAIYASHRMAGDPFVHKLHQMMLYDETNDGGATYPTPVLHNKKEWTFPDQPDISSWNHMKEGIYFEQPANFGNTPNGMVSIILQKDSVFGILDFDLDVTPDPQPSDLLGFNPLRDVCYLAQSTPASMCAQQCYYGPLFADQDYGAQTVCLR